MLLHGDPIEAEDSVVEQEQHGGGGALEDLVGRPGSSHGQAYIGVHEGG
jgi:hypothetical protein